MSVVGDTPDDVLSPEDLARIAAEADVHPHPIDAAIDRLWADMMHGSPLARSTQCWNLALDFKNRVKALVARHRAD